MVDRGPPFVALLSLRGWIKGIPYLCNSRSVLTFQLCDLLMYMKGSDCVQSQLTRDSNLPVSGLIRKAGDR